jgi:hypothetical protein
MCTEGEKGMAFDFKIIAFESSWFESHEVHFPEICATNCSQAVKNFGSTPCQGVIAVANEKIRLRAYLSCER